MKIPPRRIAAFLAAPDPEATAILVYGPDGGLVRERLDSLARTVAPRLDDPFLVSELAGSSLTDDPARLADEAAALSFGGGRRVVRVAEAGDRQAGVFKAFLDRDPEGALVLVEAGDLPPRSPLRRLFEAAANAAALPCYADDAESLAALVREMLREAGLGIARDALDHLAANLGSDRQLTRREVEKLILYMADAEAGAVVRLADAEACVGDSAAVGLEDVAYAAAGGDSAALDRALGRCLDGGESPVAVLRAAAGHLQRLHLARGLRDGGSALDAALKALRPPVFFKRAPAFRAQVESWSTDRLATAMEIVSEAELDCKSTGLPAAAVCRRALFRIAAGGRGGRR